ncbi:MAG: twin-arginine translocase subunit TatC [Cytophagaceae bacterium]|nr:twin-arginine translocase subunit TatC [Cytophagaceae bacterium]
MQDSPNKEMSFLDHLEELRWNITKSVIAILIITVFAFIMMDWIFHNVLLAPVQPDFWTYKMMCRLGDAMCIDTLNIPSFQNRTVSGQFTLHMIASFVTGFIIAFPYVFYQIWSFVKPGLSGIERKYSSGAVFFVTSLFISGILFGYYIVTPISLNFLINYQISPLIKNDFDIISYIKFVCLLVVGTGIMFQLPVAIYILTRIGLITPSFLRKYRKQAVVVMFIIAALFTPSPDFLTQLIVAIPLLLLYELSIFISASVYNKKHKDTYGVNPLE